MDVAKRDEAYRDGCELLKYLDEDEDVDEGHDETMASEQAMEE